MNRLKQVKPTRSKVIIVALLMLFAAVGATAWAVQSAIKGPKVSHAETLTFSADVVSPPDAVSFRLFKIGRTSIRAQCGAGGQFTGGTSAALFVTPGPDGAVLTNDDFGSLDLGPNQDHPIIEFDVGPGEVNGHKRTFAIFDGGGTSASGTAALMVDDTNELCTATAQAAG